MEIITGIERRRRWRPEEKLRIVAETEVPGACFAEVAKHHDVSRGLLWNWRRQARRGALGPYPTPAFLRSCPIGGVPAACRKATWGPSRRRPSGR